MTDFTRVQVGAVNNAGAADALFLKVFAGEVLTAFQNATVFDSKQRVRKIASGKSASFPATGRLGARYMVPGVTQVGQTMYHNETIITIDDLLISDAFIANIEEAKAHWDVRAPISDQMGDALAQVYDQNVARCGVLAARASNVIVDPSRPLPGGSVISAGTTVATDATVLAGTFWTAAQTLDEKFIPSKDRYVALRPAQFYLAAKTNTLINKDWDGRGSYADGTIQSIAGLTIVKTNNLPSVDDSANANLMAKYRANYTTTFGLVWVPDAMGTVKLLDLAVEKDYQIREQGTYMIAKYAVGHDKLRPECAIEISNAP
jgi:hypothetical protein